MSLKSLYKSDPVASVEGVWITYPRNSDGTQPRFKLSRMNAAANKKYAKELEAATKPYRREMELDTLDDEIGDKVMLDVFCRTILLDWEHVQPDDDGNALAFNFENATTLLGAPEWSELYVDLRERAQKAATFRQAQLERDAGN